MQNDNFQMDWWFDRIFIEMNGPRLFKYSQQFVRLRNQQFDFGYNLIYDLFVIGMKAFFDLILLLYKCISTIKQTNSNSILSFNSNRYICLLFCQQIAIYNLQSSLSLSKIPQKISDFPSQMSKNNLSNNFTAFDQRKQPIHFYPTTRSSMQQKYINNAGYQLGNVSSPSRYFSNKMSPVKSNPSTVLNMSPQTSFNVDRVMNPSYPSKYAKLSTKIQMLEKNLNRINGQHESLKEMFDRSNQLMKVEDLFIRFDRLKERLEESKRNKHVQEKRYEARYEIEYDEWMRRFGQVQKGPLLQVKINLSEAQKTTNSLLHNPTHLLPFQKILSSALQHTSSIRTNTSRYLNELLTHLKQQSLSLIQKLHLSQRITSEQQRITHKLQSIRTKLGELQCVSEYEMFLEKEHLVSRQLDRMRVECEKGKNLTEQQMERMMDQLEARFLKDQRRFVALETIDRLNFHLAGVDNAFVKVLKMYETKQQHVEMQSRQQKYNSNKKIYSSSNKKITESNIIDEVSSLQKQVSKLTRQMLGLKKFFDKTTQKLNRLQQPSVQNTEQNSSTKKEKLQADEFAESIIDLEDKIKLISTNLEFFKSKCQ